MRFTFIIFLFLITILASGAAYAQTSYQYTYDNSGNRLTRTVILLKSATIPNDSLTAKELKKPIEDQVGLQKARIYPNPTKGLLRIDLPFLAEMEAVIRVHDPSGRLVIQQTAVEMNNELNLSSYPYGIYILSIQVGQDNRKEWKIIKE